MKFTVKHLMSHGYNKLMLVVRFHSLNLVLPGMEEVRDQRWSCEIHGETFNESWLQQVDVSGTIPQLESSATRDGRGERPKVDVSGTIPQLEFSATRDGRGERPKVDVSGTIPQLESSATRDGRGERPKVDVSGTIPQLESSATRDGRGERPKVVGMEEVRDQRWSGQECFGVIFLFIII